MRFAGINKIGLSRRGFTPERIGEIHDACRILFQSGLNYMNGLRGGREAGIRRAPNATRWSKFIRDLEARHHQALRKRNRKRSKICRMNIGILEIFTYICTVERQKQVVRGRGVPLFYTYLRPVFSYDRTRKKIIEAAERNLQGTDMYVVEMHLRRPATISSCSIDSDTSVAIDACVRLSRSIEEELDRDEEDFSLTVASAGIGSELK